MKIAQSGTTLTFTFDGEPSLTFDATKASAACRAQAEMSTGWMNRLRDAAAIERKQADGTSITVTEAMRRERVAALVAHYESGSDQWEVRGGKRAAPINPAIQALAVAMGKTYAEAEAYIASTLIAEMQAKIDAGR